MSINVKDSLAIIDNSFSEFIKHNINESKFCDKIGQVLTLIMNDDDSKRTKKRIEVVMVNNTKEPFFGIRCFPVITNTEINDYQLNEQTSFKEIYKRWRDLREWCVEIDSNCFNRSELNFTPKEFTAMLLHEVGHVYYSDKVVERFWRASRESYIRLQRDERVALGALNMMYSIIFSFCALPKIWNYSKSAEKEEIFADSTVSELGYGEFLVSALQKIIRSYGNSGFKTEQEALDSVKSEIRWAALNATELIHRKNKLKDDIYYRMAKTNSNALKRMYLNLLQKLGVKAKDRYSGMIVTEQTMEFMNSNNFLEENTLIYDLQTIGHWQTVVSNAKRMAKDDVVTEAFGRNKTKKPIPPSQLDIDAISIEIDRISNHMDRRFVLDLIYDQEEKIERFEELYEFDPSLKSKYHSKLERMKNELAGFRTQVLAKKNFDKSYKVFVKYPEGYEG